MSDRIEEEDILEVIELDDTGSVISDSDSEGELADEEVEEVSERAGGGGAGDLRSVLGGLVEEGEEGEDEEGAEEGEPALPRPPPLGPDVSIQRFTGHTSAVYSVSCSSTDPGLVVSGGGDDVAYVWRVGGGEGSSSTATEPLFKLAGHTDTVVAAAFSGSGKFIATGGYDSLVKVWDPATGALLHSLEGPSGEVEWLQWHPKGDVLLAGSSDATAWMWHVKTSSVECMAVFAGHEAEVTCGCFTGSGKSVLTGSNDGTVRVWNPRSGACVATLNGHGWFEGPVNTLACSLDKPLVMAGGQDGTARLANIVTGKVLGTLPHVKPTERRPAAGGGYGDDDEDEDEEVVENAVSVECVGFCASHPLVASGASDGSLCIWDVGTLALRHRLEHSDGVIKLTWLPDSPLLVVTTADGGVHVWDGRDGKRAALFTGHEGMIFDVALLPGAGAGKQVFVTGGDDAVCRVFEMTL